MLALRDRLTLPAGLVGQSAAALSLKVLAIGFGFLYAALLARLLGPTGYGEVAVSLSLARVLADLAALGMGALAVREMAALRGAGAKTELTSFRRQALWIALITSTVVATALMLWAVLVRHSDSFAIAALLVPPLALLTVLCGIANGERRILASQIPLNAVRWLVMLPVLAALYLLGWAIAVGEVLILNLLGLLVALAAAIWLHVRSRPLRTAEAATPAPSTLVRRALPFLGLTFSTVACAEIYTLLVGFLAGSEEAGLYQPIARLAALMLIGNEALNVGLGPRIAEFSAGKGRKPLADLMPRAALASLAVTFAFGLAICLLSPLILSIFGPEFQVYRNYLYLILFAQVINCASGAAALFLTMTGSVALRLKLQFAVIAVQLSVGTALISAYGGRGAIFALASTIVISAIMHCLAARRVSGVDCSIVPLVRSSSTSLQGA